jgi:TolB-like protein/Tfp pilus assembly protein PilF
MKFCLDDGAELLYGPAASRLPDHPGGEDAAVVGVGEPATAILHETTAASEAKTRAQIRTTGEEPPSSPGGSTDRRSLSAHRAAKSLVVSLVSIAILLGGFVVYRYLSATPGQIESIAVMPFVNEGGNPDAEYLSDGMTETLIGSLSQLPNLSVKPRASVFRYKGKDLSVQAIADELGVQAILNGRVVQRGDQLTLSLELIDPAKDVVLWSQQYNRKQADLVSLQSEIARDVSNKLKTKLSGVEEQRVAKNYTANSEAYQFYLKGRYYWNKRTAENLKKAMEHFQQAADTDPNYALAYSGLADCYVVLGDYTGTSNRESLPKSRAFAERALQLDSSLVEAQTSLAYSYALLWQWDRAEIEFLKAIELNPNYPTAHHWYSLTLTENGRHDEAMREIKRAQELDPLSLIISYNVALNLLLADDVNGSIAQSRRLIDLDPNFPRAHQSLALAYLEQERYPEALAELQKAVSLSPGDRQALRDLGYGYAVAGKQSEARAVIKELQAKYEKEEAFPADVAAVFAGLGDKDQAFAWLEKDFQAREGRLARIRYHVPYESLRSDPRYADLLRRMGLNP